MRNHLSDDTSGGSSDGGERTTRKGTVNRVTEPIVAKA